MALNGISSITYDYTFVVWIDPTVIIRGCADGTRRALQCELQNGWRFKSLLRKTETPCVHRLSMFLWIVIVNQEL
jgi:hypothetical protein